MHPDPPTTTDPPTNSILVVLDADDPDATLQAVIRETAATDASYHLLAVYSTAEYSARRCARIDAGVPCDYTRDQLADEARRVANRVAREYFGPNADGVDATGAVGEKRDCIRRAVREADYDQVYVAEEPHSIWQRLLGVEQLSTELTRILPDVVSVVTVDDLGRAADRTDPDSILDPSAESTTRSHEP